MGKHTVPEGGKSTSETVRGHRSGSLPTDYQPKHAKSEPTTYGTPKDTK